MVEKLMNPIEAYYCKFNEDKRLESPHGQVEYIISMKYIHEMLELLKQRPDIHDNSSIKILDLGAGTGKYAVPLADEGYDVSALELVKHNLSRLKAKSSLVKARQGDARNLSKYQDEEFHLVLIFGPMYHLFTHEDKVKVLSQVKRVLATGGIAMIAYCMNEYGVVSYGIKEGHLTECMSDGHLTEDFHCKSTEADLYDYVRTEDIYSIAEAAQMERIKLVTPDGPTNYIRKYLKNMTQKEFESYVAYVETIAERQDCIGAAAHTIDILRK